MLKYAIYTIYLHIYLFKIKYNYWQNTEVKLKQSDLEEIWKISLFVR